MEGAHSLRRGIRGLVDSRAVPVDPRSLRYDFSVSFPSLFIGGTVFRLHALGLVKANEATSSERRSGLASQGSSGWSYVPHIPTYSLQIHEAG